MARARKFLFTVTIVGTVLLVILGILAILQNAFGPFDRIIAFINDDLGKVGDRLSGEVVTGVSLATVTLLLCMGFLPLLHKGVDAKGYLGAIGRHIFAAFIFLASNFIFGYFEKFGRFYLLVAVLASVVIVFILVEAIARAGENEKREKHLRTDLFATVVGGLLIGIIYKLITFAVAALGMGHITLGGGH